MIRNVIRSLRCHNARITRLAPLLIRFDTIIRLQPGPGVPEDKMIITAVLLQHQGRENPGVTWKEFVGSLSAEEKIVRGSIEVEMVLRLPILWRKFMGSLEP